MAGRDERFLFDALEDLDTMAAGYVRRVMEADGSDTLSDVSMKRRAGAWKRLLSGQKAREVGQGRPFSRRAVNASLRDDEHHNLMHQQDRFVLRGVAPAVPRQSRPLRPPAVAVLHGSAHRAQQPQPVRPHLMRTEIGRPSSVMRFSTCTATATSLARRSSLRKRRASPTTCL